MANALKGKTLTTLTVILPSEEVVAEVMDGVGGHLDYAGKELPRWPSEADSILHLIWP